MLSSDCMNAQGWCIHKSRKEVCGVCELGEELGDLRGDSQMCLSLEVVVECSRIHMLMIACEYTDCIIISQFSVERAGGGQGTGSLAEQGGRVWSRPGVLSWPQKPIVERTGDQEKTAGTDRTEDRHQVTTRECARVLW